MALSNNREYEAEVFHGRWRLLGWLGTQQPQRLLAMAEARVGEPMWNATHNRTLLTLGVDVLIDSRRCTWRP